MVIQPKQTHIAYRCPHCGMTVLGYIGEFALAADMLKIKCPCGHSELTVTYTAERKIRLTVPCLFCENPHYFVLTEKLFFEREIFMLGCPYAGVDICFVGQPEALQRELDRTTKELNEMFENLGVTLPGHTEEAAPSVEDNDEEYPNEEVYDIVRFLLRELMEEGSVDCPCHGGSYEVDTVGGDVRIFCTECGAERLFHGQSPTAAQEYLSIRSLMLKAPSDDPEK